MAAVSYRANTTSKQFPLISEYQGKTVIVSSADQGEPPTRYNENQREIAAPELYYAHNVLPVGEGFQSVDYVQTCSIVGTWPSSTTQNPGPWFPFTYSWNDGSNVFDIAVGGIALKFRIRGDTTWTGSALLDGTSAWPDRNRPYFTKATINGVTYGLESQPAVGVFKYKITYSAGFFFVTSYNFTGAPVGTLLRGIAAVAGYGILWTEKGIFWSSSVDPLDYTPSLVTGAGGGALQQAKGTICYVAPATFGAVIYCVDNAVAMVYTGNASYPFTFQEIKGAGGYVSDQLIASDANSIVQFAFTTYGLQSLSATQAQGALTEVSDFLSAKYFEDYNETTNAFSLTTLTTPLAKKLVLISGRFLIVSYGIRTPTQDQLFSHAIVYDIELKRYGKLKKDHYDCYQWASVVDPTAEQVLGAIAFLGFQARVDVVRLFHATSTSGGVFLLGKYQYIRVRQLALDKVFLENVNAGQVLRVSTLYAVDGKNNTEQIGVLLDSTGTQRIYAFDAVGMNHSILIIGPIDLSSLVLDFHTHGRF